MFDTFISFCFGFYFQRLQCEHSKFEEVYIVYMIMCIVGTKRASSTLVKKTGDWLFWFTKIDEKFDLLNFCVV
jgi:hypothetical protein